MQQPRQISGALQRQQHQRPVQHCTVCTMQQQPPAVIRSSSSTGITASTQRRPPPQQQHTQQPPRPHPPISRRATLAAGTAGLALLGNAQLPAWALRTVRACCATSRAGAFL
jgi:hypothetical protein